MRRSGITVWLVKIERFIARGLGDSGIVSQRYLLDKTGIDKKKLEQKHEILEIRGCKITQLPNGEYEYDFTNWQCEER